jgi:hypothetical protein
LLGCIFAIGCGKSKLKSATIGCRNQLDKKRYYNVEMQRPIGARILYQDDETLRVDKGRSDKQHMKNRGQLPETS